ncbi:uncharacterized protein LOC117643217 [Thrips palmi]|uniref:Uncharacterized protein LOC117643217 n=1 Tax=Thrips palmi TaxID=161013 RepID=A0A6P8YUV4_THRPL|nr:uncharacterized protein LOC117643217 [Thrips palmi]
MTLARLAVEYAVVLATAVAMAGYQVQCESERGFLERVLGRAEQSLQAVWARARGEADGLVQGTVQLFRRREHDALHAASLQLEQLGVDVDLNEAGDDVGDDLYGCAQATKTKYTRLLQQLRRRVEQCWGWESQEVSALFRAVEDLLLAGDRLPALLRANMNICLHQGRGRRRSRRADSQGANATSRTAPTLPPPSPFRMLRCTADSVNLTWTYVTSVPREVGRAARKTAGLLGSSHEDWAPCAQAVVRQAAGSTVQTLRDLGGCVVDRVSGTSWRRLQEAWEHPRR